MYKDILFPIDIAERSSWKYSLPVVLEYIKAFNANLHVMTVVSDYGLVSKYLPSGAVEKILNEANNDLHEFVKEHIPEGIKVQHIVSQGAVYESIIETANAIGVDLIVMSAHRPELKDYLLGPNAAKVVRHSSVSVLVIREPAGHN